MKATFQTRSPRTRTNRSAATLWIAALAAIALAGPVSVASAAGAHLAPSSTGTQGAVTGPPPLAAPTPAAVPAPAPAPVPASDPVPARLAPAQPSPVGAPATLAPYSATEPADRSPGAVAGGATSDKPDADTCPATPGEPPGRRPSAAPSARGDDAKRSGAVNSAQRERSAASGCKRSRSRRHKHKRSPKRKPARDHAKTTGAGAAAGADPMTSRISAGPLPAGVPNYFLDRFRIPPFLLPIYQAAGIQYGIRWEILAAINEIETDYGRNLSVSTAGALGWMQFMPGSWETYGVDANHDGRRDPFNPVDAIFAAARYLKAAGADKDLRKGIFSYNHAGWYVDSVLERARLIGGLPPDLVGSLSGLTQARFPVAAKAWYAHDRSARDPRRRVRRGANAALPIESDPARRSVDIHAGRRSAVIAVQDGEITAIGRTKRLGSFVRLRDAYGNSYTYGHLGSVTAHVPVPRRRVQTPASIAKELELPKRDPRPTRAASAGRHRAAKPGRQGASKPSRQARPTRTAARATNRSLRSYMTGSYGLKRKDVVLKPLVRGRRIIAGTILGRIGKPSKTQSSPHLSFEIRPAGRGAPRIDPRPILDGWKLLESTAIYRARGNTAFAGSGASATIGQVMLMSKEALTRRVLSDPRIEIYSCGRRDIEGGLIDRRVLATLEFLAGSGLKPTISSLNCGHGYHTSGGNVSAHSSGNAVDIARINGVPILGHQGAGSIADITIRRLLTLQGTVRPDQIISLMKYGGADNTLALADHDDHIHVGFRPQYARGSRGARQLASVLKPAQWTQLMDRLGRIDNPAVRLKPSRYALRVAIRRGSRSPRGG
jgi:hypothetical protein